MLAYHCLSSKWVSSKYKHTTNFDTNHDSLLLNTTYTRLPRLRFLFQVVKTQSIAVYYQILPTLVHSKTTTVYDRIQVNSGNLPQQKLTLCQYRKLQSQTSLNLFLSSQIVSSFLNTHVRLLSSSSLNVFYNMKYWLP